MNKTKRLITSIVSCMIFIAVLLFTINTAEAASIKNPVHHHSYYSGTDDTTTWTYVYFGSYPQDEVLSISMQKKIDSALKKAGKTKGDVVVDGVKYRKVDAGDTNYSANFGDLKYRYFRWTKIKWKVMFTDGKKALLIADNALDCKDYNEKLEKITWETSTIRSWLNGYSASKNKDKKDYTSKNFISTAFSSSEKSAIINTKIKNPGNHYKNEWVVIDVPGGNDTTDKVFFISINEATNSKYGFCSDRSCFSRSRQVANSDYSMAMGSYTAGDSYTLDEDKTFWWLRSPGISQEFASSIGYFGYVYNDGNDIYDIGKYVFDHQYSVVPALYLDLSKKNTYTLEEEKYDKPITLDKGQAFTYNKIEFVVTKKDREISVKSIPTNTKGKVSIPSRISYKDISYAVTGIEKKAGKDCKKITAIALGNNIKEIGESAFSGCTSITSLSLGNKVETIGSAAFKGCSALKTVIGGKKIKKIDTYAFSGCKKLATVASMPELITIGTKAYYNCSALKSFTFDTKVYSIGKSAFENCKSLVKLTFKTTQLYSFNCGKNALKGVSSNCVATVPSASKNYYTTLLKSMGYKGKVK